MSKELILRILEKILDLVLASLRLKNFGSVKTDNEPGMMVFVSLVKSRLRFFGKYGAKSFRFALCIAIYHNDIDRLRYHLVCIPLPLGSR